MTMPSLSRVVTSALALIAVSAFGADAPGPEAKMREALRNTMLQMRTLQTEKDALQVAKDQLEADKKIVDEKLAAMSKQSEADQKVAQTTIDSLHGKLDARDEEIAGLRKSLEEWKGSQKKAAALAETKEGARAKLALEKIELQRRVDDQQAKNREMYKIGAEVLSRYEKFGLGTAITAREPFVGTTRVKLENLVQDYGDKLADQRIKPESGASARPKP